MSGFRPSRPEQLLILWCGGSPEAELHLARIHLPAGTHGIGDGVGRLHQGMMCHGGRCGGRYGGIVSENLKKIEDLLDVDDVE